MSLEKIDFVIAWVDGEDPEWLRKKNNYSVKRQNVSSGDERFRANNSLHYLISSMLKYANWFNNLYIVTDNQIPKNLPDDSRIHIVDHSDIIPAVYLPTFNSDAILLNIHKIHGLAEHFVYFDDDFLLLKPTKKTDFFDKNGKPKDMSAQFVYMPRDDFSHIAINNISAINTKFSKKTAKKKNFFKYLSLKNGLMLNVFSVLVSPLPYFTRFYDPHVAISYKKSNFEAATKIWEAEINATMKNKFRSSNDVTNWLIRYYQLVIGDFSPRSHKFGKYISINDTNLIEKAINNGKYHMIVINDSEGATEQHFREYTQIMEGIAND